jgi:hypothetical protein
MSSHVVSDIDPSGSRLILLDHGQVRLDEMTADLLGSHFVAPGDSVSDAAVGKVPRRDGTYDVLIASSDDADYPQASLEDIVLGYLAGAPS